ncbi:MAG: YdcF family protein [Clostridiales bacterium]|nr:YdcF family protein [Clostridiales bacterium]MDY6040957.1 YdcF family protein [Candidatus Faecousia sp.]
MSATDKKKNPAKSAAKKKTQKAAPAKKAAPKKMPVQPAPKPWHQKSIAERTVAIKTANRRAVAAWLLILLFVMAAAVFKFCMVGYSFSALVCLCLAGVVLFYTLVPLLRKKYPVLERTLMLVFTVFLCAGVLLAAITEGIIIHASFGSPEEDAFYLVVLGAKVRADGPSLSLQNRIDAAFSYLTAHPDTIAVVTGGQGEDEHISEAQCMFDRLTAMGIEKDRIWMEEKATSTWENLRFSLDLIEEKTGSRPSRIGVLSSEYHLYRASLFAEECGVEFVGIPARTTNPVLMVNYFLREVAGVWHFMLLGGQYHA